MYWSQPARVDHMGKKMWAGGRRKNLQGASYGHLHKRGGQPLVIGCNLQFDRLWATPPTALLISNILFYLFILVL
jgi:hypothetical protein